MAGSQMGLAPETLTVLSSKGWALPQWDLTVLCRVTERFTLLLPFEPTWTNFGSWIMAPKLISASRHASVSHQGISVFGAYASQYHIAHAQRETVSMVEKGPGILSPEGSYSRYSPHLGQLLLP